MGQFINKYRTAKRIKNSLISSHTLNNRYRTAIRSVNPLTEVRHIVFGSVIIPIIVVIWVIPFECNNFEAFDFYLQT